MPHPVFIFDGIVDMVYKDFERSEVGSLSVGLGRIPRRFFGGLRRKLDSESS